MIRISTKPITYYFGLLFLAMVGMSLEIPPWWVLLPTAVLTGFLVRELFSLKELAATGPEQTLRFHLQVPPTLDLDVDVAGKMEWEWLTESRCELDGWRISTQDVVELWPISETLSSRPVSAFHLRPRRLGTWSIDRVEARFSSPLNFWTRTLFVPLKKTRVRIRPPHHALSTDDFLDLFAQAPRLIEGRRRRSISREAELFHSIRRFQTGDAIRSIDARHSALVGQPMVRTFESHRDHHLIICLDLGRGMLGMIGASRKLDYYIAAMDHLIRSAIGQGDRVSVIGFDHRVRFQYRASKSLATFAHLIETADDLQASAMESDFESLGTWVNQLSQTRAIVLLMSDVESPSVQENLHASLKNLTHKHLTAVLGLSEPLNDPQVSLAELLKSGEGQLPGNQKLVTLPAYADLLYAMNIRTQMIQSQKRWTQFGANCVVVDRTRWMSATQALYTQLRASQFA